MIPRRSFKESSVTQPTPKKENETDTTSNNSNNSSNDDKTKDNTAKEDPPKLLSAIEEEEEERRAITECLSCDGYQAEQISAEALERDLVEVQKNHGARNTRRRFRKYTPLRRTIHVLQHQPHQPAQNRHRHRPPRWRRHNPRLPTRPNPLQRSTRRRKTHQKQPLRELRKTPHPLQIPPRLPLPNIPVLPHTPPPPGQTNHHRPKRHDLPHNPCQRPLLLPGGYLPQ